MSITSSRPDDQPNQRRAARKVSLASSWPVITLISAPVRSRILASTCSPFTASRTAEVANADDVLDALVLRDAERLFDHPAQPALARPGQQVAVLQVSGEAEFGLM